MVQVKGDGIGLFCKDGASFVFRRGPSIFTVAEFDNGFWFYLFDSEIWRQVFPFSRVLFFWPIFSHFIIVIACYEVFTSCCRCNYH